MPDNKTPVEEIIDYIKKNLKKGYTKDSLRWALINQGYSKMEIEKAFRKLDQDLRQQAPKLESKPEIKYEILEPKEFAQKSYSGRRPWWKRIFGID